MNIAVIGSGYVGLVTGACLAELGNTVICVDNDSRKITALKKGIIPIFEPGLQELVRSNLKEKRLIFMTGIDAAVRRSEIVFIAVGTPPLDNGEADLTGVENVARAVACAMDDYRLIVEKSTVPVETGEWIKRTVASYVKRGVKFDVASNPEFLREGSAIHDFMHPDRIVLGVESKRARELLVDLYKPLGTQILVTNIKSAELIKHASNAFLAAKISFINAVSRICDLVGADIQEVAEGMGFDKRIGKAFLNAGLGYGGSCFPKDLDAFVTIAEKLGYDFGLLREVRRINENQKNYFYSIVKEALWMVKDKTIAVLGLAFKPDTDDIRSAASIDILRLFLNDGARVQAYDPQAMEKIKDIVPEVRLCSNPYEACRGADCMIVATEWNEFKELDFHRIKKAMKRALIVDGRNIYDPAALKKMGFIYKCIGRGINR